MSPVASLIAVAVIACPVRRPLAVNRKLAAPSSPVSPNPAVITTSPRAPRASASSTGSIAAAGSPAAGGLRPGDLLLQLDGVPVTSSGDLQRIMTVEAIGRRMEATVLRNGALVDVVIVLRELTV